LLNIISVTVSIASVCGIPTDHSPIPSVGLSVSLSGKCTVAKWLIGSRRHLGCEWSQSRDGCIRWGVVIIEGKRTVFEVNLGRVIVLGEDLFRSCSINNLPNCISLDVPDVDLPLTLFAWLAATNNSSFAESEMSVKLH